MSQRTSARASGTPTTLGLGNVTHVGYSVLTARDRSHVVHAARQVTTTRPPSAHTKPTLGVQCLASLEAPRESMGSGGSSSQNPNQCNSFSLPNNSKSLRNVGCIACHRSQQSQSQRRASVVVCFREDGRDAGTAADTRKGQGRTAGAEAGAADRADQEEHPVLDKLGQVVDACLTGNALAPSTADTMCETQSSASNGPMGQPKGFMQPDGKKGKKARHDKRKQRHKHGHDHEGHGADGVTCGSDAMHALDGVVDVSGAAASEAAGALGTAAVMQQAAPATPVFLETTLTGKIDEVIARYRLMDEKLDSLELLCKELANVPSSAAAAAALATMGNNTSLANGLFGAAPSHGLHDEHRADGDQSGIGERGGQQYKAVYLQEASAAADGQGAHASSDPTVVRSALQAAASAAADAAQSADGTGGVSAAGSAGAGSAAAASVAAAAQAMVDQGASAPAGQGSHVGTGSTSGRPLTAGAHSSQPTVGGRNLFDFNRIQAAVTEIVNSGYLESVRALRESLLVQEWDLNNKRRAHRKAVSLFERWCADQPDCAEVSWQLLDELYEGPEAVAKLPSERVRMVARSMIESCMHDRHTEVYNQCSMLAREMAKISASDLLPNAGGVGSVLKSFLPSFSFKSLPFVGRIFGRGGGGGGGGGGSS